MSARMILPIIFFGFVSTSQASFEVNLIEKRLNEIRLDQLEGRFDVEEEIKNHENTFEVVFSRMTKAESLTEAEGSRLKVELLQKKSIKY